MSDGSETIASTEVEKDQPVVAETTTPDVTPETPAEPIDDSEEIEFEGERYKVPKKLKSGFLMQADYTRKTQELADLRRGLDSEREAFGNERETFTKSIETERQLVKEIGQLQVFDDTLAEYRKVDWNAWQATDPDRANAAFREFVTLRDRRDALNSTITQKREEQSRTAQGEFTKRMAEANAHLARDIPNWNEVSRKVGEFALATGITPDELRNIATNVNATKILHKAWLADQLTSTAKSAVTTIPTEPKIEAKPVTKVSGNGSKSSATVENSDMEDYVSIRKKQGYGKR